MEVKKVKRIWVVIFNFCLLIFPSLVWGAAGEKVPDFAARTVRLEGLGGLNLFFAHWYNDSKMVFALIVTLLMGLVGIAIAAVTDVILKAVGMEVTKMEHHE